MKAVKVFKFGGPEVLEIVEQEIYEPENENEVVVEIKSVGINPVETYVRSGIAGPKEFPYIPGNFDASGVVLKVHNSVKNVKVGDRVYISASKTGTYATHVVVDQSNVHNLPDSLSFDEGAALTVSYATAYHTLFQCDNINEGERVLVHGASGGVGSAVVQWALQQKRKLTVFATASTTEGQNMLKNAGAHHVFNHKEEGYFEKIQELTDGKGLDFIVELVGNKNLDKDIAGLAFKGRIGIVGLGPGNSSEIDLMPLLRKRGKIFGLSLFNATLEENKEIHIEIQKGILDGSLKPVVGQRYRLEEVQEAHVEIMEHKNPTSGKIVLNLE